MRDGGIWRPLSWLLLAVLVLLGWGYAAHNLLRGEGRVLLGVGAAMFLLVPLVLGKLLPGHPWKLYCLLYAFCILAYDVGCVNQGFDSYAMFDKVSHFLSGIVFTVLGYCIYLFLHRLETPDNRLGIVQMCTWALFFSLFVAVIWECCEFFGYLLTGHDSQHHLDTGVFDTMGDLIACLVGSLLSVASYALTATKKVRLVTGAVVEEFRGICARP